MIKVDWSEASTKRGAVWVVTAIVGTVMVFMGLDPSPLLVLATGIAGGLGVALPDKVEK